MAIKEQLHIDESRLELDGSHARATPVVLTAEECADLYDTLATPPKPLSAEVKSAIQNYKRLKAMRIR